MFYITYKYYNKYMQYPKKIDSVPIVEAIIELRFEKDIPDDAVFGLFYKELKSDYNKFQELPIKQIPKIFISGDIKFKYQPHFKLFSGNYIIQIGPNIFAVAVKDYYPGWLEFKQEVIKRFTQIFNLNIITSLHRLGIRYIDFFESDIFNNLRLDIYEENKRLSSKDKYIRATLDIDNFKLLLQITNNGSLEKEGKKISGSVLDFDISTKKELKNNIEELDILIEKGHTYQKNKFFEILQKDFLNSLNPKY